MLEAFRASPPIMAARMTQLSGSSADPRSGRITVARITCQCQRRLCPSTRCRVRTSRHSAGRAPLASAESRLLRNSNLKRLPLKIASSHSTLRARGKRHSIAIINSPSSEMVTAAPLLALSTQTTPNIASAPRLKRCSSAPPVPYEVRDALSSAHVARLKIEARGHL